MKVSSSGSTFFIKPFIIWHFWFSIFCSAVGPKRKTKCVVDNETISKYFENVLGADPTELSEEVLNLINNDRTFFGF
jgi:hypothetical protein